MSAGTVTYRLAELAKVTLNLGYTGENETKTFIIDCKKVFDDYPNATPVLTVQPPKGLRYPAEITQDGYNIIWKIRDYDLNYDGDGEIQLKFTENGKIKKSVRGKTKIDEGLEPEGTAPTPIQDWFEHAQEVLESLDGLTVSAETLETGEDATATVSEDSQGHRHIDFGLPRGPQGDPGQDDYNDLENLPQIGGVTLQGNKTPAELGLLAGTDVTEAVEDYLEENFTNPDSPPLDRTLSSASSAAPADMVGKAAMVKDSEEEDVDLDVCDSNGNVILRMEDGHIKTKEFNSETIGDLTDLETEEKDTLVGAINEIAAAAGDKIDMPEGGTAGQVLGLDSNLDPAWINQSGGGGSGNVDVMDSESTGIDLDVSDMNGNVLMRLEGGNIRTKKFNSDNGMYESKFAYTSTAGTETITHYFPKGTRIALHLTNAADRSGDSIASQIVTYKYTDTGNTVHTLGTDYGYNFPEYILPEDAVSVSVTYPNNLTWGSNATLSFKVYSIGDIPRQPIILEVGTGKQYTNLRAALDYATSKADAFNRYEVRLYPGTYNTLSYYTAEEIATEGFQGLFVTNGVSLVGIGQRSEIILTATMSTSDYTTQKRNDVSTLNAEGNMAVKNMTIKAENIRYAMHDDTGSMGYQLNVHIYEDVTFVGTNLTSSADGERSFGAGGGNMKQIIMRNCDFSDNMVIHTSTNNVHEFTAYLENCRSRLMNFADYDSGKDAYFYLKNCNVSKIYFGRSGTHDQYLHLEGEGTNGVMVFCPAEYVYALGGVHKFLDSNVTAGKAVKLSSSMKTVSAADSLDSVYGISLGVLDGVTYVQTEGWINSNTLGLSSLSVGDYLTINTSTGAVTTGTASNAIAQVRHVDSDGIAYAKLM